MFRLELLIFIGLGVWTLWLTKQCTVSQDDGPECLNGRDINYVTRTG